MRKLLIFPVLLCIILSACQGEPGPASTTGSTSPEPEAVSLLGEPLYPGTPSEELEQRYEKHRTAYVADSLNVDKLIWHGRFTAYKGEYRKAIDIYTRGINRWSDDARLYRHRGHRYISVREFDRAIRDFEKAAQLIEGQPNEIEPDGMPNARNIPVSTLHGNIWYHLGLAYYLKHDMENALRAYRNCLASGDNNDNLVSATHWLYMILRRMDRPEEAAQYLDPVSADLDVIENMSYHNLCLFYKGVLSAEEIAAKVEEGSAGDAVGYGIGNWFFYNGEREKAKSVYENILAGTNWSSFGYIAAEADYAKFFN